MRRAALIFELRKLLSSQWDDKSEDAAVAKPGCCITFTYHSISDIFCKIFEADDLIIFSDLLLIFEYISFVRSWHGLPRSRSSHLKSLMF